MVKIMTTIMITKQQQQININDYSESQNDNKSHIAVNNSYSENNRVSP